MVRIIELKTGAMKSFIACAQPAVQLLINAATGRYISKCHRFRIKNLRQVR